MTEDQASTLISMLQTAATTGRADYAAASAQWSQYSGAFMDALIVLCGLSLFTCCLVCFMVGYMMTRRGR